MPREQTVAVMLKLWNLVQIYTSMRELENNILGNWAQSKTSWLFFHVKYLTCHLGVCLWVFHQNLVPIYTQTWKFFTFRFVKNWSRIPIFSIVVPNLGSLTLGPQEIPFSCFAQIIVHIPTIHFVKKGDCNK